MECWVFGSQLRLLLAEAAPHTPPLVHLRACLFPRVILGSQQTEVGKSPCLPGRVKACERCFCVAFKFVEVQLIYNVALVSVVQQGDSVKHI